MIKLKLMLEALATLQDYTKVVTMFRKYKMYKPVLSRTDDLISCDMFNHYLGRVEYTLTYSFKDLCLYLRRYGFNAKEDNERGTYGHRMSYSLVVLILNRNGFFK